MGTILLIGLIVCLLWLVGLTIQVIRLSQTPAVHSELDSAQSIAEAFVAAVLNGDSSTSYSLASRSFQERQPKSAQETKRLLFRFKIPYARPTDPRGPANVLVTGFQIDEKQLLDGGRGATIKGRFLAEVSPKDKADFSKFERFQLIMTRDLESGIWRVDAIISNIFFDFS